MQDIYKINYDLNLFNINKISIFNTDPLEKTIEKILEKFDDNKVKPAFSGIYFVTTIVSTFSQGVFKQKLNLVRVVGVNGPDIVKENPKDAFLCTPNNQDRSLTDVSPPAGNIVIPQSSAPPVEPTNAAPDNNTIAPGNK